MTFIQFDILQQKKGKKSIELTLNLTWNWHPRKLAENIKSANKISRKKNIVNKFENILIRNSDQICIQFPLSTTFHFIWIWNLFLCPVLYTSSIHAIKAHTHSRIQNTIGAFDDMEKEKEKKRKEMTTHSIVKSFLIQINGFNRNFHSFVAVNIGTLNIPEPVRKRFCYLKVLCNAFILSKGIFMKLGKKTLSHWLEWILFDLNNWFTCDIQSTCTDPHPHRVTADQTWNWWKSFFFFIDYALSYHLTEFMEVFEENSLQKS